MESSIKSVAEFIRQAEGKRIIRLAVGMPTIEDWPEMELRLREQAKERGFDDSDIEITDTLFSIKNTPHYVMRPKVSKHMEGTLEKRSREYIFHYEGNESFGQLKGLKVVDNALIRDTLMSGHFEYRIV